MSLVPDAILDGIAARPDDVGAWEVLTDYLLERDAPGAVLARCDLELLRGISNPDLLGALAEARAQRPKLPFEPYGGFDALWRCGYVVRLQLSTRIPGEQLAQLLAAPALAGLHHLRFEDLTAREGGRAFFEELGGQSIAQRMTQLAAAVTPHLRRFSLYLQERAMPLLPPDATQVLEALTAGLPKKVQRVDLSFSQLTEPSLEALGALARRVQELNLDGTRLTTLSLESLQALVDGAPRCTFFFGGTWRSERELIHPRVRWLTPEVVAWLEHEEKGVVIPLSPAHPHDDFESPAWPSLRRHLRRELLGWSRTGAPGLLDDGALLQLDGAAWRFRLR